MSRLNMELTEQANELGFVSLQEALEGGYEVVGDKLYFTADKAIQNAREEQLCYIDEVIDYLRNINDINNKGRMSDMIENLRKVEMYIKEN